MGVKITRKKGAGNVFLLEFDSESMSTLSLEAKRTNTAMTKILEERILPTKPRKTKDDFVPMSHDFARKWVRFPQVIRKNLVSILNNMSKPANITYIASVVTGDYKRNTSDWDEDLEAYGELPPRAPYSYFCDILGIMVDMLLSYGVVIGDRSSFSFNSKSRIDEFLDNDVNFGEWQDDIYGLRAKEPVAPSFEDISTEDEEDTFD